MATTIGTAGPYTLPPRRSRRVGKGVIVEPRTKVANDQLEAFLASLGDREYSVDPIEGSPFSVVTVTQPEDEAETAILSDVWSVAFNEEQVSLWELPWVQAELAKADPEPARLLVQDAERWASGERMVTDSQGNEIELTFTGLAAVARALGMDGALIEKVLAALFRGNATAIQSRPVLRRNIRLPRTTTLAPAFADIGSLYSTAALIGFETSIPANLSRELPTGFWVRKAPEASQSSSDNGVWEYGVEYWFVGTTYDPILYPVTYT